MRTNCDVVWGGCVCLGEIESRWWLLMDGGGRWVVCWDVSKERGRVLQLFTHVNSGVALHVTRRGGVGFGCKTEGCLQIHIGPQPPITQRGQVSF